MPFDPSRGDPRVSLNRARLVDLPGLDIPTRAKNKTGLQLVGTQALVGLIRMHADVLGLDDELDDETDDAELVRRFYRCFDDLSRGPIPQQVAHALGENLGYLLLMLKRGDAINREVRLDWDESYWEHWSTIERVWLGGGMASGQAGRSIAATAQSVLRENGAAGFGVRSADHPSSLTLIGAARQIPMRFDAALVFDFGHSLVKRATARFGVDGGLTLRVLPSLAAHCGAESPEALFTHVTDTIASTWKVEAELGRAPAPFATVSLSCYLRTGHPIQLVGCYDRLGSLAPNLQRHLADELSSMLRQPMAIELVHDATAAAAACADETNAAVITIGTSLGIGFPVGGRPRRPIGSIVVVDAVHERRPRPRPLPGPT